MGLQPPKSLKYVNCWYKFAPKGKLWGSTEKAEYRCTTTKLLVCNDTIIVLKITLHHSVSVITIFFIPKRYKKQPKTAPAPAGGEGYRGGVVGNSGPPTRIHKVILQETTATMVLYTLPAVEPIIRVNDSIGVNFYKAARLEPPSPLFKLLGFRASEPPNFCHMQRLL